MLDTLVKTVHTLSRNREWLVFTIFDLPLQDGCALWTAIQYLQLQIIMKKEDLCRARHDRAPTSKFLRTLAVGSVLYLSNLKAVAFLCF